LASLLAQRPPRFTEAYDGAMSSLGPASDNGARAVSSLRAALADKSIARVFGVHDGLSALVAQTVGCEGLWASSLGISAAHGTPDASVLTMTEVRDAAAVIARTSHLPVVCDCDTGFGDARALRRMVREFEAAGVAAVCIEDKRHPKRNSLLPGQVLVEPWEFAGKVQLAKESQRTPELMVFARIEALIAGSGMDDALDRGTLYAEAGADALVVHSKAPDAAEVLEFAAIWSEAGHTTPLVVVPTTYCHTTASELEAGGIAMVIYANQALRASIRAMTATVASIKRDGASGPIERTLAPVNVIFALTREAELQREDEHFEALVEEHRDAWHRVGAPR
jgi:phosphoenolpyruvate phosphomutase